MFLDCVQTIFPKNVIQLLEQRENQLDYIHEKAIYLTEVDTAAFTEKHLISLNAEIKQRNDLVDIINQRLQDLGYYGV